MNFSLFFNEIQNETNRILTWWREHAIDETNGGFYGEINQDNSIVPNANKGGILTARILWAFSSAYRYLKNEEDKNIATRAYAYIKEYFYDKKYGGTYWSLAYDGSVISDRKQIYSIAFTIYGLAEYYKISHDAEALELSIKLFNDIETYSRDKVLGGYFEAYSRDWKLLDDLRLSEKDRNDPKTMNTHLHLLEAYANLYTVWKQPGLKEAIVQLLHLFDKYIIVKSSKHLNLFFDKSWNKTSNTISYGHDIEASWLLHECARVLNDDVLIQYWENKAILIADAAIEGIQSDGSFIHESDPDHPYNLDYREWWVSAEGMVGFVNAYQVTGQSAYLDYAFNLWKFIKTHLMDLENGEWYWGTDASYDKLERYKMGFWKCPYHNLRACIEILNRI